MEVLATKDLITQGVRFHHQSPSLLCPHCFIERLEVPEPHTTSGFRDRYFFPSPPMDFSLLFISTPQKNDPQLIFLQILTYNLKQLIE
jgi:hypothetical protein